MGLPSSMKAIARRLPMTLFIVLSLWYIVGGTQGFRHVGTRIRQWFAPTQQELQVQAAAPPPPAINVPIRTRQLRKAILSDPLPVRYQMLIVSAIIVLAVASMYVTGRGRGP